MKKLSTPENDAKFARLSSSYDRKWQQVMDRLEGRILCYQNAAHKAKGGPKLYTRTQVEGIRAKAMVEAKLIVWMFRDDDQLLKHCPFCGLTDLDIISPDMGETPAVSMHSYPGGFRVECEGCGCNGPWHHDHQAALDAWDSRHNTQEHPPEEAK